MFNYQLTGESCDPRDRGCWNGYARTFKHRFKAPNDTAAQVKAKSYIAHKHRGNEIRELELIRFEKVRLR